MVNWKQMFNRNERQDASDEWSEYIDPNLQEFMKSDFMQEFADDCSKSLKEAGREFYNEYDEHLAIKHEMSSVLEKFGYPSFSVLEDAYSEKRQLELLQEFKKEYLNSK